jgi:hypothetical protein
LYTSCVLLSRADSDALLGSDDTEQQDADADGNQKTTKELVDARETQKVAFKKMQAAIAKYLVNARSTASPKVLASTTLDASTAITALQDAQVAVESLKKQQEDFKSQMNADAAKVKTAVASKFRQLEKTVQPVSTQNNSEPNTTDLNITNATEGTSRYAQAVQEVRTQNQTVTEATDYLKEIEAQLNRTTQQNASATSRKEQTSKMAFAKAKLKAAKRKLEDAEITQVAEKEAMQVTKAANHAATSKTKGRTGVNLDAAATALAAAAISGDATGMSQVFNESMKNHTTFLNETKEISKIDKSLDAKGEAKNGTKVNNATGLSKRDYEEERLAADVSEIKDREAREQLAETIQDIDEPPDVEGMTKQQYRQSVASTKVGVSTTTTSSPSSLIETPLDQVVHDESDDSINN